MIRLANCSCESIYEICRLGVETLQCKKRHENIWELWFGDIRICKRIMRSFSIHVATRMRQTSPAACSAATHYAADKGVKRYHHPQFGPLDKVWAIWSDLHTLASSVFVR